MSRRLDMACWAMGLALAAALIVAATALPVKADPPANGAGSERVAASPATKALQTAAKKNKYLFIFFWGDDTHDSRVMRGVFHAAMDKLTAKADAVEVQIGDTDEKEIVARYGVSQAPMPLVLAIAPNGAITKGLPGRFDENQLRSAFVSRGMAACMKALQAGKLVLLCVRQAGQPKLKDPMAAVPQAVKDFTTDEQYAGKSEALVVSADDPAETDLLGGLKVDPKSTDPVTLLIAPPGSLVATFAADATKDQIVEKVKEAQAGCGPNCKCHQH